MALTGHEWELLKALAPTFFKAGTDAGAKGTNSLIALLQDEGPMPHRVLASWFEDGHSCAAIEFLNATPHGAYVEQIEITKPATDIDFELASTDRIKKGFGLDDAEAKGGRYKWLKAKDRLPLYVPPGDAIAVLIRFKDDLKGVMSNAKLVKFDYLISIVGGKEADNPPKKNRWPGKVLLRKDGPPYEYIQRRMI
jgi:hypothetical protein